jgi:hypothetical protein
MFVWAKTMMCRLGEAILVVVVAIIVAIISGVTA